MKVNLKKPYRVASRHYLAIAAQQIKSAQRALEHGDAQRALQMVRFRHRRGRIVESLAMNVHRAKAYLVRLTGEGK